MDSRAQTTIIVDALDEVDIDDLSLPCKAFSQLLTKSEGLVKIFVSRPDDRISSNLKVAEIIELTSDLTKADIDCYIDEEVDLHLEDSDRVSEVLSLKSRPS